MDSTDRGLLNWCHDRAWAHVVEIFDQVENVSFVDRLPRRELYVGTRYRMRVKKHDLEGAVSTVLTQGALDFLEQEQPTLDGLEEIRLIAGYRWDPELREVGAATISLRDGRKNVIWMHDLDEPEGGAVSTTTPVLPPTQPVLPRITLTGDEERA
ncbi:MAG TPA: hypothetical protein VGM60_01965, partial [Pseudonocardia sp.]|uniref:hypothetical protein n=1 Tax=Pseudonocardia sp. TaxID=60912 RepID=UPI002F3E1EF2